MSKFWKADQGPADEVLIPVPTELPPLAGIDDQEVEAKRRGRQISRWALAIGLAASLVVVVAIALAALGVYAGLQDRAVRDAQAAQEHYVLGLQHVEAGEYELAVAEFELAQLYDPGLADLQEQLRKAKELAEAQAAPTSETRRDAVTNLYRRAVSHYESGELDQAVIALTELRGLDPDYQRENVETLLVTAEYQLGIGAVREDRLEDAAKHFQAVLDLKLDPGIEQQAQAQLNLLELYKAALSHWDQDWPATIQALKGLYALAPDYKDLQARLHDAHVLYAQAFAKQGEWCKAGEEYSAAVAVFPLEQTVDQRDDAQIQCQSMAQAPTPIASSLARATAKPTLRPAGSATPQAKTTPPPGIVLKGQIIYPSYDAVHQKHNLYILDLRQGTPRLLLEDAGQPALSPQGGRLAFYNYNPSHLGLSVLDLLTQQVTDLTRNVEDSMPAWSADAALIVFASNKESDRKWRIYAISSWEVRGAGAVWTYGQMPAWSPDEAQIAYHGCDFQGNSCGLWLMEPGATNQARLTSEPSDTSPSWKPDGTEVALTSNRTGNWELFAVDVATAKERRLTNHPGADVAPVWSTDGKRIAFLSNREGFWGLYVLDVKSGRVQRIVQTGDAYPDAVGERLAWTP